MKATLQFDFIADKKNNTLTIRREFAANRQLVWDAHTKAELLNKWFAPKPLTTKTAHMEFKEGGYWLYAMIDPTGPEYWGRMDYEKIKTKEGYTGLDAFCDDKGNINRELPRAHWNVTFKDAGKNSVVENIVTYNSAADLETVINMGMKDGMISCMEKLDELLASLTK